MQGHPRHTRTSFVLIYAGLEALSEKRLIQTRSDERKGRSRALDVLGVARGIDLTDRPGQVASVFRHCRAVAREVVFMNDEWLSNETPEQRYERMKTWVAAQIKPANAEHPEATPPAGG